MVQPSDEYVAEHEDYEHTPQEAWADADFSEDEEWVEGDELLADDEADVEYDDWSEYDDGEAGEDWVETEESDLERR